MPEVLYVVGAASFLLAGAFLVFVRRQGDADIILDVSRARDFTLKTVDSGSVVAVCLVPLTNRGKQDGMVVELLCEASHPGQVPGRPKLVPFAHLDGTSDDDAWYWKALLLPHGQTVMLRIGATLTFRKTDTDEDLGSLLRRLPGLKVRVHCKTIGRRSITWRLSELAFPWGEMLPKAA